MRILHLCLSSFYVDGYSYQENILPKMHKKQGHLVKIIASTETFVCNNTINYVSANSYINEYGIPVVRLPYIKYIPSFIVRKLRFYSHVYKEVDNFSPDIVFVHGGTFCSIVDVVKYLKKHPSVKCYVDSHADYYNSATNWISKTFLHRLIYKQCFKLIDPYVIKYYGTTPWRNTFLHEIYGVPKNKIEYLPMGVDDDIIPSENESRRLIEKSYNISHNDFLIVTGGKIDEQKKIHILLKSVISINNPNLVVLVFGSIKDSFLQDIQPLLKNTKVRYAGWCDTQNVMTIISAADLCCFPGTHSTLWEQSVGVGKPCIFNDWGDEMHHTNICNNSIFIDGSNETILKEKIEYLLIPDNYQIIHDNAIKAAQYFRYSNIAKISIMDNNSEQVI